MICVLQQRKRRGVLLIILQIQLPEHRVTRVRLLRWLLARHLGVAHEI
jgi:hypothetical protein